MRFRTTLELAGKTATGIRVPPEIVEALGAGKRPPVRVTIGGHMYRSSIATVSGTYMVGVSADNRAAAGVEAGDEVDIEIELDTQPREVTLPEDFAAALQAEPDASRTFGSLTYSRKQWFVQPIEGAKTAETRERRIAKAVEMLREGRTGP